LSSLALRGGLVGQQPTTKAKYRAGVQTAAAHVNNCMAITADRQSFASNHISG